MLPGGVSNPDQLRMDETAVGFVSDFLDEGKPIAEFAQGRHEPYKRGRRHVRGATLGTLPGATGGVL